LFLGMAYGGDWVLCVSSVTGLFVFINTEYKLEPRANELRAVESQAKGS
jgi:hypothetical protein